MEAFWAYQIRLWAEIRTIMSVPHNWQAMTVTAMAISGVLYFFNNLTRQRLLVMISLSVSATLGLHAMAWLVFGNRASVGDAFRFAVMLDLTSFFVCVGMTIAYGLTLLKPDPIVIPLTWIGNRLVKAGEAVLARARREHAPEHVERVAQRVEKIANKLDNGSPPVKVTVKD